MCVWSFNFFFFFQLERRHSNLVQSMDAMKGRKSECDKEHGRLRTEDKVYVMEEVLLC